MYDRFSDEEGFQVAFALSAYGLGFEPIEDPDYGTLVAYYHTWGKRPGEEEDKQNCEKDSNGLKACNYLETDYCTKEELPVDGGGSETKFYPVEEKSKADLNLFQK